MGKFKQFKLLESQQRPPILDAIRNGDIKLPTDELCQIYPRVSTPEQKKNISAEMQQDKSFALQCGWKEEQIIIDIRDLGVSGQLRMEDREAFRDMLRRIAKNKKEGRVQAIIARDVARLFRNKWEDESGKFMEICYDNDVLVVTADFVMTSVLAGTLTGLNVRQIKPGEIMSSA